MGKTGNILLIGYSIFSRFQLNPSEKIVTELNGKSISGHRIEGIVLPVSLKYVRENLPKILKERHPLIVLGIGLAPRATKPVIELVASNVASFNIPDESGEKASYEYLDNNSLQCVHTTLPVSEILGECNRRGLEIAPSVSIGTYLCGVAGYYIMRYAIERGILGGFIHVPPSTELALRHKLGNYMSPYDLVETIRCVLETSVKKALRAL